MKKLGIITLLTASLLLMGCNNVATLDTSYNSNINQNQAIQTVQTNTSVVPVVLPSNLNVAVPNSNVNTNPAVNIPASSATNGYYINVDGNAVPRPVAALSVPVGATAKCRDGEYSFSQHRRGTCSGHGGVAVWY